MPHYIDCSQAHRKGNLNHGLQQSARRFRDRLLALSQISASGESCMQLCSHMTRCPQIVNPKCSGKIHTAEADCRWQKEPKSLQQELTLPTEPAAPFCTTMSPGCSFTKSSSKHRAVTGLRSRLQVSCMPAALQPGSGVLSHEADSKPRRRQASEKCAPSVQHVHARLPVGGLQAQGRALT